MDVVLNRRTGRRTAALPILCILLWTPAAASAQEFEASARQTVQRAAQQAAAVVARAVPDQTHTILYVEPVRTDTDRLTRLGSRLRGVLQVTLVHHYRNARLVDGPTTGALAASAIRVMVELQPFDHQVTILVRILDRDGLLIDADLVDMPRSTAVSALLQPDLWPVADERPAADAPQLTLPIPEESRSETPVAPPPEPPPDRPAPPEPRPPSPSPERPLAPEPVPEPAPAPPEPPGGQATAPSAPPEPLPDEPSPSAETPAAQIPTTQTASEQPDDPYEPDDEAGFEVPVPAEADVRFERTLTGGDRDRFELSLPAAAAVTVAIEAEIETLIALYRSGNAVPVGVHNRRFTGVLEAGTYVIQVMTDDAAATGAYALAVSTAPEPSQAAGQDESAPAETSPRPGAALPPSGAEPAAEADALAQSTELQAGESQERLIRPAPEWLQLTADPGFYDVTVASASEALRASLHRTRDEPAFLELVPSAAGEQVGALFVGADLPVLRIDAPESDLGLRYSVAFEPATPPRAFADQRWTEQADVGSLKHHTLRIFSRDVYQMSLEAESASASVAEATVYQIPGMIPTPPQEPGVSRFDLPARDYLVLIRPLDGGSVGRVCWHLAQGVWNCS